MPGIVDITLQGDGSLKQWVDAGNVVRHFTVERNAVKMIYLTSGMQGGKPSVGIAVLDHVKHEIMFLELSHAMLQTAAAAFKVQAEKEGYWP